MTDTDLVRIEIGDDGVAVLTLADPERRNALRLEMTRALAAAVETALAADVGAIVLAAEPPVFCAGGSLDDLLAPRAPLEESYVGMLALADAPVVTIAAVGGPAIGAGVNLPLVCDVVVSVAGGPLRPPVARRRHPPRRRPPLAPGPADRTAGSRRPGAVRRRPRRPRRGRGRPGLALRGHRDELLPEARRLAARAAGRNGELVRRTKATLRATVDLPDVADAVRLELEAQTWSMAQPHFRQTARTPPPPLDRDTRVSRIPPSSLLFS